MATSDAVIRVSRPSGVRGPLTQRRLITAATIGAGVVGAGLLPWALDAAPWLSGAGLSLVFPGAGLVYTTPWPWWSWMGLAHLLLVAATLYGAALALRRMLLRGDYLTAPAVLLGSALASAWMGSQHPHSHHPQPHHDWVPPIAAALATGLPLALAVREQLRARRAHRVADERDAYLAQAASLTQSPLQEASPAVITPADTPAPGDDTVHDELDRVRLAAWLEQLVLHSEPDIWAGFGKFGDEYLLAAMRYRIWAAIVTLCYLHFCHTPAYSGYRVEAMQRLIALFTRREVWQYWIRENRWGLLRNSPDPIATSSNIMFTGYVALAIAMYRRATGDTRYDSPGSLVFTWHDGRQFLYDQPALVARMVTNFHRARLTLWPCEPQLVFPFCNSVALAALRMHDTATGSSHAAGITPRFLHRLHTEFTAPDGDLVPFQVSSFGAALRSPRGITNTAQVAALLGPLDPAFEWRTRHLLRREELETGLYLRTREPGSQAPTDRDWDGSHRNRANALGWSMFLAREHGEDTWYRKLREAARDLQTPEDAFQPFDTSVHASGILALGMVGRTGAWRDMLLGGEHGPRPGPRLAEADWPAVAVATAHTDGHDHHAVLYPGPNTPQPASARHEFGYDQLVPGRTYRVDGATVDQVTADSNGSAVVPVILTERTELQLRPAH